ncbi:hypothetical protein N7534_011272 [Penicillium rubens]|nr:hypothetical protein N7534_011272 [Penicillium rubens]
MPISLLDRPNVLGCIHERTSVALPAAAASPRILYEDLSENYLSGNSALGGRAPFEDLPQAASYYNGEYCGAHIAPITLPIKREKETPVESTWIY